MDKQDERTILVLEDSDEDFDTAWEGLRRTGHSARLVRALNGDECVEMLCGSTGEAALRPQLILLDLNTPVRDGRHALHEIKNDSRLRQIPVVVLTTSSNPRDLDDCYAAGVNAYHVKPLRFPDHLALLNVIYDYWLTYTSLPIEGNGQS